MKKIKQNMKKNKNVANLDKVDSRARVIMQTLIVTKKEKPPRKTNHHIPGTKNGKKTKMSRKSKNLHPLGGEPREVVDEENLK